MWEWGRAPQAALPQPQAQPRTCQLLSLTKAAHQGMFDLQLLAWPNSGPRVSILGPNSGVMRGRMEHGVGSLRVNPSTDKTWPSLFFFF